MVVGLLGNKSPDSNRFILVTPKSENDVRLQATLGNQNPTGLPVGVVSDKGMKNFADKTKQKLGVSCEKLPGAGAAGGLGFAFLAYLNAELTPGVQLIIQAAGIEEKIKSADIVVTGEGRLDNQTVMGKAPIGVAKLAKKYGKKVIAFAGSVSDDVGLCNENGIDAFFPIVRGVTTLENAMQMENAVKNMEFAVEQVFRVL